MDLTSILLQSMLNDSSVKSLSKKTGASKDEVSSVLTAALPLLLKGAGQQAEDEETAESFADGRNGGHTLHDVRRNKTAFFFFHNALTPLFLSLFFLHSIV